MAESNINRDFYAALLEMENPSKDGNNPHFNSRYATLGSVLDVIKPTLAKHNLVPRQRVMPSDDGWKLVTMVISSEGEQMVVDERPFKFSGTPQQNGSEETYLRRYAYMCCMGLTAVDDDANEATAGANENERILNNLRKAYSAWLKSSGLSKIDAEEEFTNSVGFSPKDMASQDRAGLDKAANWLKGQVA